MAPCPFCKKEHEFTREEALQILRRTPDTLRLLLDAVSPEAFNHKEGEQWSPRQIMIHLVDTEFVYGFRFRLIMGENDPVLTPFDQNAWIETFSYSELDATQLIRAFTPIRRVNLELLNSVEPALFDKTGRHPEFGVISVGIMIPHLAAHDLNHLQQINDRIPVQ